SGIARSTNFSSPQHVPASAVGSGIPSLRSEFEKRRRSHSTAAANQSIKSGGTSGLQTPSLPAGTTTWATSSGTRQSARKASAPDSTADSVISSTNESLQSKVPVSRSAAAALRLSLDQRRRAIEAGRQRAMMANHQAATQRHHAAFQKLLQTEQRRRAKKEEPDMSDMEASSAAAMVSQSDGDHLISSSAVDGDNSGNQMNNEFGPYDTDQSAVSASQREQVTDVDEDFSLRSTDAATARARTPSLLQDQLNYPTSNVTETRESHVHPEPDLSLIEAAITPDELAPSSKEASPTEFESTLPKEKSDQVFRDSRAPTASRSSELSQQQHQQQPEEDHSSSEAMEYIGSVASEKPVRSVSPARDWYNSMPERRRSSGNPQATNAMRQSASGRPRRQVQDEHYPVETAVMKSRGSNYGGRGVPQRRQVGPPVQQSPRMSKRRQPQQSAAGPTMSGGRRYEVTSQSLSVEPRNRLGRPNSQLITSQQQRLRSSRRNRVHPLAVSENYDWPAGMTRSTDPEWDEPGDDEYDEDEGEEEEELEVYTNGTGARRCSDVDDEYYDEEDADADYDARDSRHRGGLMIYDGDRQMTSDTEEEDDHDQIDPRRSHPHRLWRDVDRFSSERSSIAFSSSSRRPVKSRYRKRDQMRASFDPSSTSHGGFRPTEMTTVVDAEALDKLNRNLLDLQSGLERLSAQQQQVLLASSSATAAVALVAGANTQQALFNSPNLVPAPPPVTVQPPSPAGFTRATWSERPKLCDLSHSQINANQTEPSSEEQAFASPTPMVDAFTRSESSEPSAQSRPIQSKETEPPVQVNQAFFVDLNTKQGSPSPTEPKAPDPPALEQTPPPGEKSEVSTAPDKSTTSKVFFIGFDEPDPQVRFPGSNLLPSLFLCAFESMLMQRKCDQLEARRAAEKAMAAQHLEALRSSGRGEKHSLALAELERKNNEKERREAILQAYLSRKEQAEAQCHRHQNLYPVRPGSAALSLSSSNLSTKGKRSVSQNRPSKTLPRSSELRSSRVGSLRASSATRKPRSMETSTTATRGNADGEAVESSEADADARQERRLVRAAEASQKQKQKPNGKPTGRMTSGLSLSSLHRLGASDQPSSGPGVSVAGLSQPKLFVKPKAKSNRMVIVNAIGHCCLAGAVNEPMKQATLKVS
ncbi:unnamed protein product, partial [Echinostoma caproni]|uniref:CKK domain-containing protein n=1 Tax=Echinostoma caproni TaxID=27848 RepID=A0A183AHC9_9TREM